MPNKQFRLSMPLEKAERLIQESEHLGFKTPQRYICHLLNDRVPDMKQKIQKLYEKRGTLTKSVNQLTAERDDLKARMEAELTQWIRPLALTKTHEVLEEIKANRHELLMLYAFQFIFPETPEDVGKLIQQHNLQPGVFYMKHACMKLPFYVEQITVRDKRILDLQKTYAQNTESLKAERDEFEKLLHAETDVCNKYDERVKSLKKALKTIATRLGVPDTEEHIVQRIKEVEKEAENLQVLQAQFNEQSEVITRLAAQRTQLEYDRDFYKNKSWLRKLWEKMGGRITLPPTVPTQPEDDDIPF